MDTEIFSETNRVDAPMAHVLATRMNDRSLSSLTLEDEHKLIQESCDDPDAFAPLYEKYYDRVYLYLLRRSANQQLSEDLTAETFFRAMRKISTYRPQNVPFLAWLFRIAHNQLMSHYRKEKVRYLFRIRKENEESLLTDPRVHLLHKTDLDKAGCTLARLIQKLKPKDQFLITLRYFEELSVQEASSAVGMNPGAARTRINRAMKKLRAIIETDAPELLGLLTGGES